MSGLVVKINDRFRNRQIEFFNDFRIDLKHDSVASTFAFTFFFDPNNKEHKELACVTHFHEVTIEFEGEQLIKGVITSNTFRHSRVKQLASFSGYSLPGVLEDCEIPPTLYPLQSDKLSLTEIAQKLISPFKKNYNLDMVVDPSVSVKMSKVFDTSTASESQTIKDYLTELASQKNIVITHDEFGRLLFTDAKTESQPIWTIDATKGVPEGTNLELNYDGQGMHSHIYMQKQASIDGGNSGYSTIRNPYVIGSVYRPTVKTQSSGDDNDTGLAARRALANELRGVTLTVQTDRWMHQGKLFRPNKTISVFDPELYIYKKVNWFIESVTFEGNQESTTATLNCVLPEVYSEKTPVSIFSGINLHA